MSDFVTVQVSGLAQLLSYGRIRLRSWKGDYLHRPDSPQGVTTWSTGIGNEWQPIAGPNGSVMLRSWKGDYLHRPDSPQGVTTWSTGIGNEWHLEPNGDTFRLRSWKGDLLHRPDSPQGVTTWSNGEWILEGLRVQPVAGELFNTGSWGSGSVCGFKSGSTFTQRFVAAIDSFPTELAVRMGSNQNPYGARIEIRVGDELRYSRDYIDLRQRTSDWATVFPNVDFPKAVRAGEWVSVSITPDRDTAMAALSLNNPQCPPSSLSGYPACNACFYLRGDVTAHGGTLATPNPAVIASTMDEGGANWALNGPFTQAFKAIGHGVPRELGVVMGSNQNPFGCRVTVSVRGVQVYDRAFSDLRQRQSDWAVVFPLDGIPAVQSGDDVTFTVTPDRSIGFSGIPSDRVGFVKGTAPGYGACRATFFMVV